MDTNELAWCAGFVDGEGHFGCGIRSAGFRPYPAPHLNVHQVDRFVLDRMVSALGVGKVDGPYGPYSGNRQAHYQFVLGDFEGVQASIALLWKWLSPIKRAQASEVLIKASKMIRHLKENPVKKGRKPK